MALVYVGGTTSEGAGTSDGIGGSTFNVSLTGLTGGTGSAPQAGDIVIVAHANTANAARTLGISGYTNIANQRANDSQDVNFISGYKIMSGTPDTSVTVTNSGSGGHMVVVHVWRGVDQANPMDTAELTATGTNGNQVNSPSISPVTPGAVVITAGAGVDGDSITVSTVPTGYTNNLSQQRANGAVNDGITVIASKVWSGSGAEDPAAWVFSSSDANDSWCAVTYALRPAADAMNTSNFFQLF